MPSPVFCIAVLSTVLLAAPVARAEEAPPELVRDIGRYALFGRYNIDWGGAARMPVRGAVGASFFKVDFSVALHWNSPEAYVAAPIVRAAPGSTFHHVFARNHEHLAVDHPVTRYEGDLVDPVHYPVMPAVTCGGTSVTVDSATSPRTLAPGRYDVVTVLQDQRLELVAGGRYEICSMRLRSGSTILVHADNVILLRDYLSTNARVQMTGTGACGARWLAANEANSPGGAAFEFGQGTGAANRARIAGQFFTPGRITMAQNNDYTGRFWAETIDGAAGDEPTRTLDDCAAPVCGDGRLDPGEQCDDGNNRNGDCCSSFCERLPAGSACDDGSFCTATDVCDGAGVCRGSGDPCTGADGDGNCSESCNEELDDCSGPDADGSACQDGLFCNGADRCAAGQCAWHTGSPCPGADDDANCSESCDEASDRCDARDPLGSACNDGRYCTVVDSCGADGTCTGSGSPCPFADGDGNCAESCDELADACTAVDAQGTPCDDGMFCTASDQCDGRGFCRGSGDPCTSGSGSDAACSDACDETANACSAPDLDGSPCDDGIACTVGERCIGGVCAPGGSTICDDGNPCTDEFCAPTGKCLSTYNEAACDDGNACTLNDRCDRGTCVGGPALDCRDDDLCTADLCDPASGECRHAYAPAPSCHQLATAVTRIDVAYSPVDGQVIERLTSSWRGQRGMDWTERDELGDPTAGDAFSVCFYDESDGVPELAYRLDLTPDKMAEAQWKRSWSAAELVYKLKATSGTAQGVSQVKLIVDKDNTALLRLKAGANVGCNGECRSKFDPPAPLADGRFFAMEPGMTVQWTSSTGSCWSSRYEQARENQTGEFYAISRAVAP
ncbi:MAG TPA: hypothetical protein VEC57_15450 [Candidatus Limnocylindrales bacterium]|nr:hypothetical protein [Candidatus Limnocylindrales bacterium]